MCDENDTFNILVINENKIEYRKLVVNIYRQFKTHKIYINLQLKAIRYEYPTEKKTVAAEVMAVENKRFLYAFSKIAFRYHHQTEG